MSAQTPFLVFSGTNSRYLAEKICNSLGCPLGQMNIQHFADGEFAVSYEESIRGRDVFLVQSTFPNSDNLMELLLMIDAAKRASAHSVIAVIPYFGWARQDRKDKPRVSIGAKLIADMLSTAGIDRLITMDLHADQIQGFFNVPVDHLYASSIFLDYIKTSLPLDNLCIATPDVGGTKRASSYSKYLGLPMVICHKSRLRANEVAEMRIIGDVKGLDVLLIDDMVDTAGIRKKGKVNEDLEYYSVIRSIRAIENSDVCVLMLDATRGIESQDLNIFSLVQKNKKGLVVCVNKWDLVEDKSQKVIDTFTSAIRERLAPFTDFPILFISALTKQRILKVLETAKDVYENRQRRVPTAKLNEIMLPIIENYPPPAWKGKYIKIKYITQLPAGQVPSFVFFCNLPQWIKEPYKRFLENKIRENWNFTGTPINVFIREK